MGKTIEESLPRNPQEGSRMPEPGPQENRVVIIETGRPALPQPTGRVFPHPIDDDQMGPDYFG